MKLYHIKATFTHRGRLSIWMAKKLGLVRFWLGATFFYWVATFSSLSPKVYGHSQWRIFFSFGVLNFMYPLPICSKTFLTISNESSRALHVCILWEPWPCYDPNFPDFDNLKKLLLVKMDLCLHYWWLLLLNCSLQTTLNCSPLNCYIMWFVGWICVMLKNEHSQFLFK